MRDALLNLGTINFASTNLGAAGAVAFPDLVDLGVAGRDLGVGTQLVVECHVETDWAATAAFVSHFSLFTTNDTSTALTTQVLAGSTQQLASSGMIGNNAGAYVIAQPKAGLKVFMVIPPYPTFDRTATADAQRDTPGRYLGVNVWSFPAVAGVVNVGTVSARVITWPAAWKAYAVGADLH